MGSLRSVLKNRITREYEGSSVKKNYLIILVLIMFKKLSDFSSSVVRHKLCTPKPLVSNGSNVFNASMCGTSAKKHRRVKSFFF